MPHVLPAHSGATDEGSAPCEGRPWVPTLMLPLFPARRKDCARTLTGLENCEPLLALGRTRCTRRQNNVVPRYPGIERTCLSVRAPLLFPTRKELGHSLGMVSSRSSSVTPNAL